MKADKKKELLKILLPPIVTLIGVIVVTYIGSNTYKNQKSYDQQEELYTDFLNDLHDLYEAYDRLAVEWDIRDPDQGEAALTEERLNILRQTRRAILVEDNAHFIVLHGSRDFKQAVQDFNFGSFESIETIIEEAKKALGIEYRDRSVLELDNQILGINIGNNYRQ